MYKTTNFIYFPYHVPAQFYYIRKSRFQTFSNICQFFTICPPLAAPVKNIFFLHYEFQRKPKNAALNPFHIFSPQVYQQGSKVHTGGHWLPLCCHANLLRVAKERRRLSGQDHHILLYLHIITDLQKQAVLHRTGRKDVSYRQKILGYNFSELLRELMEKDIRMFRDCSHSTW